jgi:hypothetical protein
LSAEEILIEGRRLTGANFFCDEPAAILDVEIDPAKFDAFFVKWKKTVEALHLRLERASPKVLFRTHKLGQSLIVTAPIDALYSTIELLEEVFTKLTSNNNTSLTTETLHTLSTKYKAIYKEEERRDIRKLPFSGLRKTLCNMGFRSTAFGSRLEIV